MGAGRKERLCTGTALLHECCAWQELHAFCSEKPVGCAQPSFRMACCDRSLLLRPQALITSLGSCKLPLISHEWNHALCDLLTSLTPVSRTQNRAVKNLFKGPNYLEDVAGTVGKLERGDLKLRVRALEAERALNRVQVRRAQPAIFLGLWVG